MRERLTCWGRREKTENNRETWILKTTRRGCSGPKAAGSHLPLLARPQPPLYDKMLALRKICASEGLFMKGLEAKFFNIFFSILKSRDITLPAKVYLVKAMVFPVVMHGSESWTIKKAEHQRLDAFELWCWRRLLRVPWMARRSNQSILVGNQS